MSTTHFDKVCPVCGVKISESGTQFKLATGAIVDKDFVYSRICQYVPAGRPEKCSNTSGVYDEAQGWEGLDGLPA